MTDLSQINSYVKYFPWGERTDHNCDHSKISVVFFVFKTIFGI